MRRLTRTTDRQGRCGLRSAGTKDNTKPAITGLPRAVPEVSTSARNSHARTRISRQRMIPAALQAINGRKGRVTLLRMRMDLAFGKTGLHLDLPDGFRYRVLQARSAQPLA